KSDRFYSFVPDYVIHSLAANSEVLETTFGKACCLKHFFNILPRQHHIAGVLQEPDIPCHEGRGRKPENLPEGIVPRHHSENRSQWLVADVAVIRICRNFLRSKLLLCIFRVIFTYPRTLFQLS